MVFVPFVILGVYLFAWYTWMTTVLFSDAECDKPLGIWLGSYLVYSLSAKHVQVFCTRYVCMYTPDPTTPIPHRVKILHFFLAWFPVALMLYGVHLVHASKTCKHTNPALYKFTKWYTWFSLTCYTVGVFF